MHAITAPRYKYWLPSFRKGGLERQKLVENIIEAWKPLERAYQNQNDQLKNRSSPSFQKKG